VFDAPGQDNSGAWPNNFQKGVCSGHFTISETYLALLICPEDQVVSDRGNLSYAVNGGIQRIWWEDANSLGGLNPTHRPGHNNSTVVGNPIDFTGDGLYDANDQAAAKNMGLCWIGSPNGNSVHDVRRTPSSISDGLTTTILLGESLKVGYTDPTPNSGALG